MTLPAPRDQLCSCIWLPRIRAKARLAQRGDLPKEYQRSFCHTAGVDGHFLKHFELTQDDLFAACDQPDAEFATWFLNLRGNSDAKIAQWNELAVNLGRPDYPMAERFQWAIKTIYAHVADQDPQTVFEALEADEGITQ